jgi:hypothetical protein
MTDMATWLCQPIANILIIVTLVWLIVLTQRIRTLARRLGRHVCPRVEFPWAEPSTARPATGPHQSDNQYAQPINAYDLIARVMQSNPQQPSRKPDPTSTTPHGRHVLPEPPLTAGRGGVSTPSTSPSPPSTNESGDYPADL